MASPICWSGEGLTPPSPQKASPQAVPYVLVPPKAAPALKTPWNGGGGLEPTCRPEPYLSVVGPPSRQAATPRPLNHRLPCTPRQSHAAWSSRAVPWPPPSTPLPSTRTQLRTAPSAPVIHAACWGLSGPQDGRHLQQPAWGPGACWEGSQWQPPARPQPVHGPWPSEVACWLRDTDQSRGPARTALGADAPAQLLC